MLLRVRIAGIGPGGMRHHGGIELLAEFAAHLGNAALSVFRKLQRLRAVLHGIDGFAGPVLEIAQHAFQFLLHLAQLFTLFLAAFDGKMLAFTRHFQLARAKLGPLDINLPQLRMQTVEKARDILRL